jgi:hypothetical protein
MKAKRRVKVRFYGDGYLFSSEDIFVSLQKPVFFFTPHPSKAIPIATIELELQYYNIGRIRWVTLNLYGRDLPVYEADYIFMRGTHKFSYEYECAFEVLYGVYGAGSIAETIVFKDAKPIDNEWRLKVSLTGPTSSNFSYYPEFSLFPYVGPPVYRNEFRGYKTATIEITPDNITEVNHPQKKPQPLLLLRNVYEGQNYAADLIAYSFFGGIRGQELSRRLLIFLDNVSIELQHDNDGGWEDYDWNLATEHSAIIRPLNSVRKLAQPLVDENYSNILRVGENQGNFDDYVYDVVIREMVLRGYDQDYQYTIPVRVRNWRPGEFDYGGNDVLTCWYPWRAEVRRPDFISFSTMNYWLVGYRHYAFPFVDPLVREISDLGFEVTRGRRHEPPDWGDELILPYGGFVFKKKIRNTFVKVPKHLRSFSVTADQLDISFSVTPQPSEAMGP